MAWEDPASCAKPAVARLEATRQMTASRLKENESELPVCRTIEFFSLYIRRGALRDTKALTPDVFPAQSQTTCLVFLHQRQFDKALLTRRVSVEDALDRFVVIPGLGPEDGSHKSLRVAVI